MAFSNGNGMVKSLRIGQSNAAKSPFFFVMERRSTTIILTSYLQEDGIV